MNRHDAKDIRPGDKLRLKPLWNQTTRTDKMPDEIVVYQTKPAINSETNVLVRIISLKGEERWLDAGWFEHC
jgi:hypothetical protein